MNRLSSLALTAIAAMALSAPAFANSTPKAAGTADDTGVGDQRIICKKHLETGSLVKRVKQCFTKAEWDRIAEAEHKGVGRLVDELTGKPAGN